LAALAVVITAGLVFLVVPLMTALPEGVAMRLAGTDVTEQELQQRVDGLEALYGIAEPAEDQARDQFNRETAKAIAGSMVIERACTERGIVISEKEAQDAVTKLIETRFAAGGRDAFVKLLGEVGASMQNVLDEIKRQRGFTQLFDQVTKDVPEVTEADARAAYDTYRARMVTPEQRRLSNIVVSSSEQAEQVLQRAREGADFAALAKEVSLDPSTRDAAGDLGFVARAKLAEPYAAAAFAASSGSLFGPVQTESGWNLGKVVEVRPESPLRFEIVQEQLRKELRDERELQTWSAWLAEQMDEADPQYADKYRPKDADAVPPAPLPSAPPAQSPPVAPGGQPAGPR
jgi:peptidyl-prolyl cis-trans isomerase C